MTILSITHDKNSTLYNLLYTTNKQTKHVTDDRILTTKFFLIQ